MDHLLFLFLCLSVICISCILCKCVELLIVYLPKTCLFTYSRFMDVFLLIMVPVWQYSFERDYLHVFYTFIFYVMLQLSMY